MTLDVIAIDCKLEQFENAESLIDVTRVGISIDCKIEHLKNAKLPIDVTLDGIAIDCKVIHSENAKLAIDVTLDGIEYVVIGCLDGKQTRISKLLVKRISSLET